MLLIISLYPGGRRSTQALQLTLINTPSPHGELGVEADRGAGSEPLLVTAEGHGAEWDRGSPLRCPGGRKVRLLQDHC